MLWQEQEMSCDLWGRKFSLLDSDCFRNDWLCWHVRGLGVPTRGLQSCNRATLGLRSRLYPVVPIGAWDASGDIGPVGLLSIDA